MPEYRADRQRAIEQLKKLHASETAVLEAVACGPAIIPELRWLLFNREPSGLFNVRIRAIHALAKLGARGVLLNFLQTRQPIADPTEQIGEDAVISAAAQVLAHDDEPGLFEALLKLAERPCLAGVIFALGVAQRPQAIPALVRALSEDSSRLIAERALMAFGEFVQPALLNVAISPRKNSSQSESQLRQRRSAVYLLAQIGVSPEMWRKMRVLADDPDPGITIVICEMAFQIGSARDKRNAARRLVQLFAKVEWQDREAIKRLLTDNASTVQAFIQPTTP